MHSYAHIIQTMSTPHHRSEMANACIAVMEADFFKSFTEPTRLQIFKQLILQGRADVGTISNALPQDRSVITRHLQFLEKSGVVRSQSEGRRVFYEINGEEILKKLQAMVSLFQIMVPMCCGSDSKNTTAINTTKASI